MRRRAKNTNKVYEGGFVGEKQNISDADKPFPSQLDRIEKYVWLSQNRTTVNGEVVDMEEVLWKELFSGKKSKLNNDINGRLGEFFNSIFDKQNMGSETKYAVI